MRGGTIFMAIYIIASIIEFVVDLWYYKHFVDLDDFDTHVKETQGYDISVFKSMHKFVFCISTINFVIAIIALHIEILDFIV